jgi:hypothetical protein
LSGVHDSLTKGNIDRSGEAGAEICERTKAGRVKVFVILPLSQSLRACLINCEETRDSCSEKDRWDKTEETVKYGETGHIKRLPYYVLVTRTGVKGRDESLGYEDCGEKDSKDTRKENDNRNAKKDLKFALPSTMTLNISRAVFFRREPSLASTTRKHKGAHGCPSITKTTDRGERRGIEAE